MVKRRRVAVRFLSGRYDTVTEQHARACLSGHGSAALSDKYWTSTGNAYYRLLPFKDAKRGTLATR